MAGFRRGTQKPPPGALVNLDHPFAQGLLLCVPFNDGCSGTPVDDAVTTGWPQALRGTAIAGTLPPPITLIPVRQAAGTPAWGSNRDGWCSALIVSGTNHTGWQLGSGGSVSSAWLPTTAVTIAVVRRKRDTTLRDANLFGVGGAWSGTGLMHAAVPAVDGTVYWDFGGGSAPNRVTAAGLSFSTTIPERWVFHAGPRGSAIWQNGVNVGSQATAITRTATTDALCLNSGGVPGDNQDINYFAIYATQWSDDLCRWWSAEPYAHLYREPLRSSLFMRPLVPSVTFPYLSSVGVG